MNAARGRLWAAAAAFAALCGGLLTSAGPASAATFVPISGSGSTWSYDAINQWIDGVSPQGMTVNYTADGSTDGRQLFGQGVQDFAASEIPYGVQDGSNANPVPSRGYTYVPDTAGGVAFMYHLTIGGQRVTNLRLSGATIAAIFTNKITTWNDPAIAADNPGLTLPDEPIIPVVRTDSSGATMAFTQWMSATQGSAWTAYCAVVGLSSCTPTTTYSVQPGTAMVGQAGDLGVSGYVAQVSAEGTIGFTEYSRALETGFPVAKVLNTAGYYTAPTPLNVGLSLLATQINLVFGTPQYATGDLSRVYTDTDPRTYELSYFSYLIVPIDTSFSFSADKGYTLGVFGQYLLCQGQQQVDQLGYAALPINLVMEGYDQLAKVPGNQVPDPTQSAMAACDNPTIGPDGTEALDSTDPMPPSCDQQGPVQCAAAVNAVGTEPLAVSIPATGSFTLTVGTGTVTLAVSGADATGTLNPITVSDTRNTYPGWSVTGQESSFTGSGSAAGSMIPADQLGWVPTATSLAPGSALGPTVAPASPGLGTTAAVLAQATAGTGVGTSGLGANLTLAIPATVPAGPYAGTLTVTAVTSLP
jgi:phosphate transport system substrate-binding protein